MKHLINKLLFAAIAFHFLLFSFHCATAQNVTAAKIACPNNIWVNSYNGVMFHQRTDLSVPNRDMRLEAIFYYNSSANRINCGYGNGWSLGCELSYVQTDTSVIIVQGDGRKDEFLASGSSYVAPAGVFGTLTTENGGFLLTTKEGVKYRFADASHRKVTSITTRSGNTENYAYEGGKLMSITDAAGRAIRFHYTDTLLTSITTSFDSRTWAYAYDTVGNLVSRTDPKGMTLYFDYNAQNRLTSLTDADGYTTTITYNLEGTAHRVQTANTDKSIRYEPTSNQTIVVDYVDENNAQFTTYRWDNQGRVVSKTGNCCGMSNSYVYDADNNVISITDANGHTSTYTYDERGNKTSSTNAFGQTEYYTYNDQNKVTSYTDRRGNTTTYTYDADGNLTQAEDPLHHTSQYTYNEYGQMLTSTDANGHSQTRTYDQYGNLATITDALGNVTTMAYTEAGLIATITEPTGAVAHYTYDGTEHLTAVRDALGNTQSMQYDGRGNTTVTADALGRTTTNVYDENSRVISKTESLGKVSTISYNARGNVLQTTDAIGGTMRYFYDDRNQLTEVIDAAGDTTRYAYDAVGNHIGTRTPMGQEITYVYDVEDRLIETSDQQGTIERRRYDAVGNLVSQVDASGDSVRYEYDAVNRLTAFYDALGNGTYFGYDNVGNQISITDALGNTTTRAYDAMNRMVSETDALNNTTTYTYDAAGRLLSLTDAMGRTTAYEYDAIGRLVNISFANGKTRHFWYDAVGNCIKERDEMGSEKVHVYDALNRRISTSYPDGTSDAFTYDLNDNMLSAVNAYANETFTYDASGRMLSENINGKTTTYSYNVAGREMTLTYPGGRTVTQRYNVRNNMSSVLSGNTEIASFQYNANGNLSSRSYANGISSSYSYNANSALTQIDEGGVLSLTMNYNAVGDITQIRNNNDYSRSEKYSYDALRRLSSFQRGYLSGSYMYDVTAQMQYNMDAMGNRTQTISQNGSSTSYSTNSMNAYTAVGGVSMQYDAAGSLLNDGQHSYSYDYNHRMVAVDNGNTAVYRYDALGRRVMRQTVTETLYYYYAGDQVIEERDASDVVVATYVYGDGIDNVLQMQRGSNNYYYHKNHLGSVMAITDANGSVVEHYEYDPYGTPSIYDAYGNIIAVSSIGNHILFTGRDYDTETGLYYYRARHYSPFLGRFLQYDPEGYVDGYSLYKYAMCNPVLFLDPRGTNIRIAMTIGAFVKAEAPKMIRKLLVIARTGKGSVGNITMNQIEAMSASFNWKEITRGLFTVSSIMLATNMTQAAENESCNNDDNEMIRQSMANAGKAAAIQKINANKWQTAGWTALGAAIGAFAGPGGAVMGAVSSFITSIVMDGLDGFYSGAYREWQKYQSKSVQDESSGNDENNDDCTEKRNCK